MYFFNSERNFDAYACKKKEVIIFFVIKELNISTRKESQKSI